jgi:hypothetical protein
LLSFSRVARVVAAGLLLCWARAAAAQVQAGDLNMNLSGVVSGGYSADYGNQTPSDHSLNFGGTASLAGYFYDPNFLSFTLTPYLNQSRADSNYQSISDASGLNFSSGIFSGSNYPGSVNYSKAYNSEGNYALPGLPSYTTHGDSDSFGINWSENAPDVPSLNFGFQRGSTDYSVYGANDTGSSTFDSINIHSGYLTHGFAMGAFYQYGTSSSVIPQLFTSTNEPVNSDTSTDSFGFNISHALPMRGGFSANFTRSSFSTDDQGFSFGGTVDSITANAGIQPSNKLHLSLGLNYSDNLGGTLFEAASSSGGVPLPANASEKSDSFDAQGVASYAILPNLQVLGDVERRDQSFLGESVGATTAGGGILYTRPLLGGSFNASGTVNDTRLDSMDVNTIGSVGTVNFSRRIQKWFFGASCSYAQNAQTLLVTYTTGYYNYSGNVRRRFRTVNWTASASGSRTALTQQAGVENRSQSYSTGFTFGRWASLTGSYAVANGNAVQTGAGLVTTPVPTPVLPSSLIILYGGKSYSFGLGASPVRRLTIGLSFSNSSSNTSGDTTASSNKDLQFTAYTQYQFRKMYLTGGYARLSQSFSASPVPPANVSSYYFGVSRWFKFF